jgi:predicted glycosyltransferase
MFLGILGEGFMKIVVDISHPAHIHYFKHFIWEMQKRGHEFLITASEKDVSYRLLAAYGFDYIKLGNYGKSLIQKAINLPLMDLRMYNAIKGFNPDFCIGSGSIRVAHVAYMLKSVSILLESTEHSGEQHRLYIPFVSTILTPSCFKKDLGAKQIRFDGYKELMYLHPDYFTPDLAVLTEIGLTEGDPFIIVRFVSWDASHDVGQHGIRDKVGLVKALEQYGRVLITSEGALPEELQPYQIQVSPEKLHDLLYYATLYVGEGGTTASEAAVLGTPSLYVSSLAGTMGNFIELEETYDLLYSFTDGGAALDKAVEILQDPKSKDKWRIKRDRLLTDKIDVTEFMVWFVENYPRSFTEMKEHPEAQYSCASVPGGAL